MNKTRRQFVVGAGTVVIGAAVPLPLVALPEHRILRDHHGMWDLKTQDEILADIKALIKLLAAEAEVPLGRLHGHPR